MKLNSFFSKQSVILTAIIISGFAFALLKLNGTPIDQTLWAEDGLIFINQAREFGIYSLWISYAGYFHLYPRLIACLSSLFDLSATPFIFLIGWFIAYISLIFITANRLLQYEKPVWAGLLIILMMAQPHSGEVFLTLTNAQWFMGAALAIYLLMPIKNKPSIFEISWLLIASLTGPFALLLFPILFMQLVIYKDWSERKFVYLIIGLGSLIQLSAILSSDRLATAVFDKNTDHWLQAFFIFISFNSTTIVAKAAASVFWLTTMYAFVCQLINNDDKITRQALLSLLLGAMFFLGSGLLAEKAHPQFLNPLGNAARYFFIPYLLIFLAACLLVLNRPISKYIVYVALSVLAVSSFSAMNAFSFSILNRQDLQFNAYAEFLNIKSDIVIPINPQWSGSPWSIRLTDNTNVTNKTAITPISINSADIKILNVANTTEKAGNIDIQMVFSVDGKCTDSRYLGVEILLSRPDVGGRIQLFWSENDRFSVHQSLLRYYPSGDVVAQFALPRKNVRYLRFDPIEQQSPMSLNAVHLYCLA